jgi:hypothetical protein
MSGSVHNPLYLLDKDIIEFMEREMMYWNPWSSCGSGKHFDGDWINFICLIKVHFFGQKPKVETNLGIVQN